MTPSYDHSVNAGEHGPRTMCCRTKLHLGSQLRKVQAEKTHASSQLYHMTALPACSALLLCDSSRASLHKCINSYIDSTCHIFPLTFHLFQSTLINAANDEAVCTLLAFDVTSDLHIDVAFRP